MSETKAGNIEAIRDWSKRYFYTKSDVSEFFTKLNTGLTAYKLTIIGPADADIAITDNDQTNPQEYNINLGSNGVYVGLFFFNANNTLSITGTGIATTWTLSNYIDTIMLVPLVIATPIMTSNTTPSGEVIYSTQFSATYAAWKAFQQVIDNNGWVTATAGFPAYIGYHFTSPTIITKLVTNNRNYNGTPSQIAAPQKFIFQASGNGSNWINIMNCEAIDLGYAAQNEYVFENSDPYEYYRLYITEATSSDSVSLSKINLYKPDI